MSQFAYALYKIVLSFRNLVSQDIPFFCLSWDVSSLLLWGILCLYLTVASTSKRTEKKLEKSIK